MLLRSSRSAQQLSTKEAGAGGAVAGFLGRRVANMAGRMGRFAMKHPMGTLATVGGGSAAAAEATPAIQRSRFALSPQYMRARQMSGFRLAPQPTMQMSPQSGLLRR